METGETRKEHRMTRNLLASCALALIPMMTMSAAAADDQALSKASNELVGYAKLVEEAKTKGAEIATVAAFVYPELYDCGKHVKDAVKAGAGDDTRLYADWPEHLPTYQDGSITLAAAREVCTDFDVWRPRVRAAGAVLIAAQRLAQDGAAAGWEADGRVCLERIDALDPASREVAMKIGDQTMTLGEGRALCAQLAGEVAGEIAAQQAAQAEKRAAIEAKWKKAGMKGARLRLFVDNELNGGGFAWYAAGCRKEITDPKKLAKAKKLFQWTNGPSGGTLVTKYSFKGNKYKEVAREFFLVEKAYAYCR
jgi:hypothetical protein